MESNRKLLIFLSHASEDKPVVRILCQRLKDDGFDPWFDEEQLLPGQDWHLEIQQAMRKSDAMLLCFSGKSVSKEGYVQREYKRAMEFQEEKPDGTIFVIPVRLDNQEIPFFLREKQYVDFPSGYDKLVRSLKVRAEKLGKSTIISDPLSVNISTTKTKEENGSFKQVQLVLEGDFKDFNETRKEDLRLVLASLLRVDSDDIRILQAYSGSIVVVLEMPKIAVNRLRVLGAQRDLRLKAKGVVSIHIQGEKKIDLLAIRSKKTEKPTILLNRYVLTTELGRGSFGSVHKAHDRLQNSDVVIKLYSQMRTNNEKSDAFRKRFEREVEVLARLSHPNLMKIIDFGYYKNSPFIVMPYLPKATLKELLGKPTSYSEAASLLLPIAKALSYAHKMGVVHRDVKPSNILFTDNGEPVLSDFGAIETLTSDGVTKAGAKFTGALSYVAPEQLEGEANTQSDIYALGIIYYEIITGKNPLILENFSNRFTKPYLERPSSYVSALPEVVDQVILRATATKLENRYTSMDQFVVDLRKLAIKDVASQPMPYVINNDISELKNEGSDQLDNPVESKGLELVNKFEQQINELINEKDFSNARRLLQVVERLGKDGEYAAQKLRKQFGL